MVQGDLLGRALLIKDTGEGAVRLLGLAGVEIEHQNVVPQAELGVCPAVEEQIGPPSIVGIGQGAAGHAPGLAAVGHVLHPVRVDDQQLVQGVLPHAIQGGKLSFVGLEELVPHGLLLVKAGEDHAVYIFPVRGAVLVQDEALPLGQKVIEKVVIGQHGPVL